MAEQWRSSPSVSRLATLQATLDASPRVTRHQRAPIQRVKGKGGEDERSLVAKKVAENKQLIETALPQLPEHSQKLLRHIARTASPYLPQLLSMDTPIIANMLLGLRFMSAEDLVIPRDMQGYQDLFMQLASTQIVRDQPLAIEDRARIEQLEREEEGVPYYSQRQEAGLLAGMLESPNRHDQPEFPIPKQIHRFWTGGPLSESAMENLMDSAAKTEGTDWKHTLWYSSRIEKLMEKQGRIKPQKLRERELQRQQLLGLGYDVRAIESLAKSGNFFSGYQNATSPVTSSELEGTADMAYKTFASGGGYDDIKYFSDIARLLYLHEIGGMHMDVDIGLGDMDLDTTYHHQDPEGRVPLLGSLLRNSDDKEPIANLNFLAELKQRGTIPNSAMAKYLEAVGGLANQAKYGSGMYNALIASRPKNPNVANALAEFMRTVKTKKGLSTGMVFNKILLTGGRKGVDIEEAMSQSVPPYLLRLRHLTPDSDT